MRRSTLCRDPYWGSAQGTRCADAAKDYCLCSLHFPAETVYRRLLDYACASTMALLPLPDLGGLEQRTPRKSMSKHCDWFSDITGFAEECNRGTSESPLIHDNESSPNEAVIATPLVTFP